MSGFSPSDGLIYIMIAIFTFTVAYILLQFIPWAVQSARRRK